MKLTVLDPSYLAAEISRNLLKWVQDVKLKLDTALKNAGVSSIIAGSNVVLSPTDGLGDLKISIAPTYGTGAPSSTPAEDSLYFDTSASPYHGYVYHSAAWHRFS